MVTAGKGIEELSNEIASSHLTKHISKEALEQIEWHKSQGHRLVLVTATLWPLAKPIADKLGFDDFFASDIPLTKEGIVKGTEKGKQIPRRKGKIEVVEKDAKDNDIDLTNSWGYGNSKADIYFMQLCGNPITINPTLLYNAFFRAICFCSLSVFEKKNSFTAKNPSKGMHNSAIT